MRPLLSPSMRALVRSGELLPFAFLLCPTRRDACKSWRLFLRCLYFVLGFAFRESPLMARASTARDAWGQPGDAFETRLRCGSGRGDATVLAEMRQWPPRCGSSC